MNKFIRVFIIFIIFFIYSDVFAQEYLEYIEKAILYDKAGDYKAAIKYYTKAIDLGANFPDIYSNRAGCYYKLIQYSDAIKDYNNSISIDQNYNGVEYNYRNIGSCYLRLKKYNDATPYFLKYLEYKPDTPEIFYILAVCYVELEDNENAIKYYSKSIESNYRKDNSYYYRGIHIL